MPYAHASCGPAIFPLPLFLQVSEHAIVQDFVKQKHNERGVFKVLQLMLRRGEIQYRMQRKMLFRVK
jgi:DNA replication licensing factor MCM5